MKHRLQPLAIILAAILVVFALSRLIAYLALNAHLLPHSVFLNIHGFRLHHFVYGNILIFITSFLAIAARLRLNWNWLALFYGIGLGLVLDEFPLWMGDIHELNSYVLWIPYAPYAIALVSALLLWLSLTWPTGKRTSNFQ